MLGTLFSKTHITHKIIQINIDIMLITQERQMKR